MKIKLKIGPRTNFDASSIKFVPISEVPAIEPIGDVSYTYDKNCDYYKEAFREGYVQCFEDMQRLIQLDIMDMPGDF